MNRSLVWVVLLGVLILGTLQFLRGPNASTIGPASASQQASALVVKNMRIYEQNGRLAYQGDVDLAPVLERIARGERDPHRNDGVIHRNREHKLPTHDDPAYYREYVVRTPGLDSVGPQRLIIGKGNEAFYTPDHYKTFIRIR